MDCTPKKGLRITQKSSESLHDSNYPIIVQKNLQNVADSDDRSYSPRIISQNKALKPQINKEAVEGLLKHKLSAKTYEQKIIQQKRESYKYRKNNEEQSVDDKIKTKQLLKNINLDKLLFNRRILMPAPANFKTDGKGQQPLTTKNEDQDQIKIKNNHRRASSIDEQEGMQRVQITEVDNHFGINNTTE